MVADDEKREPKGIPLDHLIKQVDVEALRSEWAKQFTGPPQQDITILGCYEGARTGADSLHQSFRGAKVTYRIYRPPYWLFSSLERLLRLVKLGHWCYRERDLGDQVRLEIKTVPVSPYPEGDAPAIRREDLEKMHKAMQEQIERQASAIWYTVPLSKEEADAFQSKLEELSERREEIDAHLQGQKLPNPLQQ